MIVVQILSHLYIYDSENKYKLYRMQVLWTWDQMVWSHGPPRVWQQVVVVVLLVLLNHHLLSRYG